MIELRPYQREAVEYALRKKRSVLVLPTGTGKTLIGAFFVKRLIELGKANRFLVMVPTRILAEQTLSVYRRVGIDSNAVYGVHRRDERERLWRCTKVAISTPETVYNDLDLVKVDAIVADECHHAVGDDAYAKVLREIRCEYVLGLTAYIPARRRREIEELIGEIKVWPFRDLRDYVSEWVGEIFESYLNEREMEVYREIERRRQESRGARRLVYTLALKYLAKEGALALKESISRRNSLSKLLGDMRDDISALRDLHKLDQFFKVLRVHDGFEKAIVFVERVVVAKRIFSELERKYDVSLLIGGKVKDVLEDVRRSEIVVSTSAGEEGVDLPTADLLISWSNTSSPLRFIQRHGRILRKAGGGPKFVAYIVTPFTVDADDLIYSIERVREHMDIGVDREVLERVWRKTRSVSVLDVLENPMPIELVKDLTGLSEREVRMALEMGVRRGHLIYLYTELGKVYVRRDRALRLRFNPRYVGTVKVNCGGRRRRFSGGFKELLERLKRCLPLEGMDVTVMRREGDLIVYEHKRYGFEIGDEKILRVVLENALS